MKVIPLSSSIYLLLFINKKHCPVLKILIFPLLFNYNNNN